MSLTKRDGGEVVSMASLAALVAELRREGKRVVHARGTFDLLQRSGIARLEIARAAGNALVATVSARGEGALYLPVLDPQLRAQVVAALPFVTAVAVEEGLTAEECVARVGADMITEADEPPGAPEATNHRPDDLQVLDASAREKVIYPRREAFSTDAEAFLGRFRSRYTATDVIRALQALKPLRVLVVGDAIIDEYHFVAPYGMPRKAPIVAAQFLDAEAYAGGSLAVANHLAGFCGEVHLVTTLGERDSREELIRRNLRQNVEPTFFFRPGKPTTVKRRYLQRFLLQKLFEVSFFDDHPLTEELDAALAAHVARELPKYDLVVVADFGHGLLSPATIAALGASRTFLALNTQVNSINYGYHVITKYPRADYACIDEIETRMACRDRAGPVSGLLVELAEQLGCRSMTVTRGHHGSLTYQRDGDLVSVPILSRQVIDTVGAGDAYLAITAPCMRMGYPPDLVGFIGNAVGALAVRIVGNETSVGPEELFEFIHILMR